jgi:hypothetical protein
VRPARALELRQAQALLRAPAHHHRA